ncbi:MAG: hypothetical protein JOY78_02700 [Pseudonocardia sp.]|nr:hypothetical protein [Pseudonocardia sp.]
MAADTHSALLDVTALDVTVLGVTGINFTVLGSAVLDSAAMPAETCRVGLYRRRQLGNGANPAIAIIHEKTDGDGPLRRWGSKYADRRSRHHAANATTKNPSLTSRACAVIIGHRCCAA